MKKSRYSNEQIVRILREADKDPVPEVAKRLGDAIAVSDKVTLPNAQNTYRPVKEFACLV